MPESTLDRYLQVDLTVDQVEHLNELLYPGLAFERPEEQSIFVALRNGQVIFK